MKLEPKAKPVKIRIKSGGEEHSSLDSLMDKFSVEDLLPLQKDGRLTRWLKQLKKDDLAEKVELFSVKKDEHNKTTDNSLCNFIKIFFTNIEYDDIWKIAEFWCDDKNNKPNGEALFIYLIDNQLSDNIDDKINIFNQYGGYLQNYDWKKVFNSYLEMEEADSNVLFKVGIMFYDSALYAQKYKTYGELFLKKAIKFGSDAAFEKLYGSIKMNKYNFIQVKAILDLYKNDYCGFHKNNSLNSIFINISNPVVNSIKEILLSFSYFCDSNTWKEPLINISFFDNEISLAKILVDGCNYKIFNKFPLWERERREYTLNKLSEINDEMEFLSDIRQENFQRISINNILKELAIRIVNKSNRLVIP